MSEEDIDTILLQHMYRRRKQAVQRTTYYAFDSSCYNTVHKDRAVGETRFNELVKYKAEHADCDVPQRQGKLGGITRRAR